MRNLGSGCTLLGRILRMASFALALCILPGVPHAQDIVIGQVGPFTDLPPPNGGDIRDAAKAYFDEVNANGGVRGRKITLFTLDDKFKGELFATRFKEALARKPVALITPIGSEALGWLMKEKVLDDADIVIVNAVPGAEAFRTPGHPKLFHVRAGDKAQIHYIARHCKTLGLNNLVVLHQDLLVGTAAVVAMREAAGQIGGLKIGAIQAKHAVDTLKAAAEQAAASDAQGVLVVGTPKFMADSVLALRKAGYKRSTFALSYLPTPLAVQVVGLEGVRGLGITQTFPNPNGSNLPVQRDFRATMDKFGPKLEAYSPLHFEGYISARVLVAALRRTTGAITPMSIAAALHEFGAQDFGGFRVEFGQGNNGSNWVDIGVVSSAGKLLY